MSPMMALWVAALTALGPVESLSVLPVDRRTEVVIAVTGPVSVNDFPLREPSRLVLDLTGAQLALEQDRFGAINRGGVLGIRVSQYQSEVVRVVLELAQNVEYSVVQTDGEVRISFPNPGGPFEPWYSDPERARLAPPVIAPEQQATAAATPETAAGGAAAPAPAARKQVPQRRITVYFKDSPLIDVLATFAEFSGKSIVPAKSVDGKVNADIRDQPWDIALDAILRSHGLSANEMESGIIIVDAFAEIREAEKVEDIVTRPFRIQYISVDSLAPSIEKLLSDRGRVTTSTATNTLVVSDGRTIVNERIAPMIAQLDAREPQVTIAAKIIFVDRTALDELGVAYDLKDSQGNQLNQLVTGGFDRNGDGVITQDEETDEDVVLLGGASIAALANANYRPALPALEVVTSLVLGRHSLITFIDALSQLSVSDVQATPVIRTMNHRAAHVQVGEETPIRVIDVGSSTGGGGVPPRASVQMKNTGIILRVTPHITGNQVLLELHAERSGLAPAPSDIGFTFQKQESVTQVLLDNGETGVISGLTIIEKTTSRAGIPILMDLPVIGALFRSTSEREIKRDLLIMVTPHIVRESEA